MPKITRNTPGPRTQKTPFIPWHACKTAPWKPPGPLYDNLHNRNSPPGPYSLVLGLVRAPTPDPRGGYHTVIHFPFGWEPYPLPARGFLYFGLGKRLVPVDGRPAADPQWEFFIPWPQLQIYLLHTGGFHYT